MKNESYRCAIHGFRGQIIEIRSRRTRAPRGAMMIVAPNLLLAAAAFSVVLMVPQIAELALPSLLLFSVASVRPPKRGESRRWFAAALIVPHVFLYGALAVCAATQCLYYAYGGVGAGVCFATFFLALLSAGTPCWWRRYGLAVGLSVLVTAAFTAR